MSLLSTFQQAQQQKPIKVWVLAPHVHTNDANLDYYYDFSQSIAEYTNVFEQLQLDWQWQPVTMVDYPTIIESIAATQSTNTPLVLNLCDGDEINGTPGISVLNLLKEKKLIFTGADAFFYDITTSKIPMKQAFDAHHVPNANWEEVKENDANIPAIFDRIGRPLILKPAVSGGSMGVGVRNVVETDAAFAGQLQQMFAGYRGWNLTIGGVIAESFIEGPEYTTLIVGDAQATDRCIVYPPVERVFHPSLPEKEKFLSFDRLWEIYEDEAPVDNDANFYEYQQPATELIDAIERMSLAAYKAVGGKGYGRVDLRMDRKTKKIYVLEVNAQCGISEDENFTSIGAILRYANKTFTQLVQEILETAILAHQQNQPKAKTKTIKTTKMKMTA
jgi:D-alanine-D-alanine ligase